MQPSVMEPSVDYDPRQDLDEDLETSTESCSSCRYWNAGVCMKIRTSSESPKIVAEDKTAHLKTPDDFYCILYEPHEQEREPDEDLIRQAVGNVLGGPRGETQIRR